MFYIHDSIINLICYFFHRVTRACRGLGDGESAIVLVVPGGGDVDGVVAAGKGGHIDGAATGFGVGNDSVPPVIIDGHVIGDVGVIYNGDYAQLAVIVHIGHVGRNVHLGVMLL